jgi:hypothetical protein
MEKVRLRSIMPRLMESGSSIAERGLRASLVAGALYDVAAALAIFFALPLLSRFLGIPIPPDPLYVRFVGILLLGLALFYAVAAGGARPDRHLAAAAATFRILGGLAVGLQVPLAGAPAGFLSFAAADVAFGAWHAVALRRLGSNVIPLLLAGIGLGRSGRGTPSTRTTQ